jgi:hypothetical protein
VGRAIVGSVNLSNVKLLAALAVCSEVRRTSLAAGMVTALFTGGLPFVGVSPGLIMGRLSVLPPAFGFALHLFVGVIYGALFCLAISRSRNAWTLLGATVATLTLYALNFAATNLWNLPRPLPETDALFAHVIFGAVFTVFFKLAEIGVSESSTPMRSAES